METERLDSEVDANAGEYIEDDAPAWSAFVEAVRRYHDYLPSLVERFGDDAFGIVAGSMIGFMADRHKVYVKSSPTLEQSMSVAIHIERLAMAMHNVKGGAPMFGEAGECECREEAAAISDEYDRLGSERDYLRRLPWRP